MKHAFLFGGTWFNLLGLQPGKFKTGIDCPDYFARPTKWWIKYGELYEKFPTKQQRDCRWEEIQAKFLPAPVNSVDIPPGMDCYMLEKGDVHVQNASPHTVTVDIEVKKPDITDCKNFFCRAEKQELANYRQLTYHVSEHDLGLIKQKLAHAEAHNKELAECNFQRQSQVAELKEKAANLEICNGNQVTQIREYRDERDKARSRNCELSEMMEGVRNHNRLLEKELEETKLKIPTYVERYNWQEYKAQGEQLDKAQDEIKRLHTKLEQTEKSLRNELASKQAIVVRQAHSLREKNKVISAISKVVRDHEGDEEDEI